jgi:hypothetical protein
MQGLTAAVDELYATGWTTLDGIGCPRHVDGRAYPGAERVRQEFDGAGAEFDVKKVDRYQCYRATWRDTGTGQGGSAVGQSEAEAVVYALARYRREQAAVGTTR